MRDAMDITGLVLIIGLSILMGFAIANRHPDLKLCAKMEAMRAPPERINLGAESRYWDVKELCQFADDLKGPYEKVYFEMANRKYTCEESK